MSLTEELNSLRLELADCLLGADVSDNLLDLTLEFIGSKFSCSRVYIFEIHRNGTFDNTYEWCAEGIAPQIEFLKGESVELIRGWIDVFEQGRPVVIEDLEAIVEEMPTVYLTLKPQDIQSLVAVALKSRGEIFGFIGLDNPHSSKFCDIANFLEAIAPNILLAINGVNRISALKKVSSYDELTGVYSSQFLSSNLKDFKTAETVGVVYCDIIDVKSINALQGRAAGDEAIKSCCKLIKEFFPKDDIYRLNGDKFVVIVYNRGVEYFRQCLAEFKLAAQDHPQHIAVGSSWTSAKPIDIFEQFYEAEAQMFVEKEDYYAVTTAVRRSGDSEKFAVVSRGDFEEYIENNFFNPKLLVNSMASAEGSIYVYFGDLQTNMYYISDNMRDTFGFDSNLVYNMAEKWESRIINPSERQAYKDDISDLFAKKRRIHDLRYRVKDVHDNYTWIHCRGEVLWSPDKTVPLFFSGCIVRQEYEFTVDPVTNFLRETAAIRRLSALNESSKCTIIGFSLNNFSEINELHGKAKGDELLRDISQRLINDFEDKVSFYRLDGLRFAAIMNEDCSEDPEQIITEIRYLVNLRYRHHGVAVQTPCSMTVLSVQHDEMTPQEMISNIIVLLNIAKSSRDNSYVAHSNKSIKEQHTMAEMIFELTKNVQNNFENFRIVVQPTFSAKTHGIVSGEVLLRWTFKGKNIPPNVFVPLLEKHRLIYAVGEWLFEQVVKTTVRIHSINPELDMAFNVSYLQVLDANFFTHMQKVLSNYKLDAQRLVLELTETNFDESPQKLSEFFNSCIDLGIKVALDDFGNGYSSLGMLLKYPTNIVKLDKSLLSEMSTSEDKQKFINSIVYACHAFGKIVCAEGIETQTELQLMTDADCDYIQGYYFSKPLEISEYFNLIAESFRK